MAVEIIIEIYREIGSIMHVTIRVRRLSFDNILSNFFVEHNNFSELLTEHLDFHIKVISYFK